MAVVTYRRAILFAPSPTLILHDRNGEFLAEVGGDPNRDGGYWPPGEISDKIVAATLAAEDRRFASHPGVDWRALGRAVSQNLKSGKRLSGASTIAMQVVRLEYPGPRTYWRKASEALTALWLVGKYGRQAVLTHYLTLAPYGNRVRGIGYASRRYLDKPVADLDWAEAAFLSALPQAPGRMNPFSKSGRGQAVARAQRILSYLEIQGVLSETEKEAAFDHLQALEVPELHARPPTAMHAVLQLQTRLTGCAAEASCPVRALAQRPVVETTIDTALEQSVSELLARRVNEWRADGAGNAAAIVLNAKTAEVLAWVGSTDYSDTANAGAIDFTSTRRSPGSTLKPFVYALGLQRGEITPATVLSDIRRPDGLVVNSDDRYLGPMLPRAALANSRNVPAVEVLERVGYPYVWELFDALQLRAGLNQSLENFGTGLVLGNLPVTLADLVRAYLVFTNDGVTRELVWYKGQPEPVGQRIFSPEVVRQIALFLSDPDARLPTFPRLGASEYPFAVAVKTGTSSGYHDAWAAAYSADYLVGVWVGHPDFRPMRELSGFRAGATLAHDILLTLPHPDTHGLADFSFPPPRGAHPVRLCALSGKRAGAACDRAVVEWFGEGQEPNADCDEHFVRSIDDRSGEPASAQTPKANLQVRTFVDLPPIYGEWAASVGAKTTARVPALSLEPTGSSVHIRAPRDGMRIVRDPEMPAAASTLGLTAIAPAKAEIIWYVDGAPYQTVRFPFVARWPLVSGEHTFQARVAYQQEKSEIVRVKVE